MAKQLAIDMGLNLNHSLLPRRKSFTTDELNLRQQIYWGLYCHDKLFASYTGRVCTFLVCPHLSLASILDK